VGVTECVGECVGPAPAWKVVVGVNVFGVGVTEKVGNKFVAVGVNVSGVGVTVGVNVSEVGVKVSGVGVTE
jgi:hypothetical protein